MARSRGQIRKRGENKYLVRIYLGRIDGKRKYKSKMVHGDKEKAEQRLTEMLHRKDRGLVSHASDTKLAEFLDDWLETKQTMVRPATFKNYEKASRLYLRPMLGHLKLSNIDSRLVQGFINELEQEKGLGPSYIRQIHSTLRQVLQKAVTWEMIPINPADGGRIDLPRKRSRDYRILSKEEGARLLSVTQGNRLYALWALLLSTGLRPQEAFALKWEDLEDGWLRVRRVVALSDGDGQKWEVVNEMKTEKSRRRIRLSESLVEVLENHRRRQLKEMMEAGNPQEREGFIFTRNPQSGKFIYHEPVRKSFNEALEEAGLPQEIRVYDLRHTHISQLIIDGVDLKKASVRAGHSTIKLTADTYAHLSDEAEEEMAEVSEQTWGDAMSGTGEGKSTRTSSKLELLGHARGK